MGLFSLDDAVLYAVSEEDKVLAKGIAKHAGIEYRELKHHRFANGALQTNLQGSVRGKFVVFVGSVVGDIDKCMAHLTLAVRTARDSHAERILVVLPYTVYCRSDKKDEPYTAWGLDHFADQIQMAGAWGVLLCDLHNEASAVSFKINRDVVTARKSLLDYVEENFNIGAVVAADSGGVKHSRKIAEKRLGVLHGVVDKIRSSGGSTTNSTGVFGVDVKGLNVLVFEDEYATGGTAYDTAEHIWRAGAKNVYLACSHAVFCSKKPLAGPIIAMATAHAEVMTTGQNEKAVFMDILQALFSSTGPDGSDVIDNARIYTKIISTNTCPMTSLKQELIDREKLLVLDVSPEIGKSVKHIIAGIPLGHLIEYSNGEAND